MQIKNYIVDNIDIIMDRLEKELCQCGISYVRIENELHFDNKIIRFYDLAMHKNVIISCLFNNISIDYFPSILDNLDALNNEKFFCPIEEMSYYKKETNYQQPKKKNYKQESKRVNQLLKKYKR